MPAAYAAACFPDAATARAAHCIEGYPLDVATEGGVVTYACVGTSETGLELTRASTAASEPEGLSIATAYAECNPLSVGNRVITADMAAQAFSWGMAMVVSLYLVAWGCGRVLDSIWTKRD